MYMYNTWIWSAKNFVVQKYDLQLKKHSMQSNSNKTKKTCEGLYLWIKEVHVYCKIYSFYKFLNTFEQLMFIIIPQASEFLSINPLSISDDIYPLYKV